MIMKIANRNIGPSLPPLIIPEIGINHEGDFSKAKQMVHDAHNAGAECVKFQCHIVNDEMVENDVVPANAEESIWTMMKRCSLSFDEEIELKELTESFGMIYLSTPFSRAAVERLEELGVDAYKIGSGECNNYPLIEHIAKKGKPVILSTGMNDIHSIQKGVDILEKHSVDYAVLHCTSMYPTPYEKVRLGGMLDLQEAFPNAPVGLSDHSYGNYTAFGAVALGASIIEKHFTSDNTWPGPDIPISITPAELKDLVTGCNAIYQARGGKKEILKEEAPTIKFAYASVVAIDDIKMGEPFTPENIWVKRPGTGEILAEHYDELINMVSTRDIKKDEQLKWKDIE
jgi:sialic acid synthase SpsE